MHAPFRYLVLGDALAVMGIDWIGEKEEASSRSQKQFMHSPNTLDHALIFLKCVVNWEENHEFSVT